MDQETALKCVSLHCQDDAFKNQRHFDFYIEKLADETIAENVDGLNEAGVFASVKRVTLEVVSKHHSLADPSLF